MRLPEHFIPVNDLARLDTAAASIDVVWRRLAQQGYAVPVLFFEFFRQFDGDDFDVDSRCLYYRECVREMFTCQFAQWMLGIRGQLNLYYRSAYLDCLGDLSRGDDRAAVESVQAQRLVRVVAHYEWFFQSTAEADRDIVRAYTEAVSRLKQQEMEQLFSQRPELLDLAADSFGAAKHSMSELLAGSGFFYDVKRSNRNVQAFSLELADSATDLVFSLARNKEFDYAWRCEMGLVKRTMKKSFATPASMYPDFPVLLDISQLIPLSYLYLAHDNDERTMKFGLIFLSSAMTVLGDHLNSVL